MEIRNLGGNLRENEKFVSELKKEEGI